MPLSAIENSTQRFSDQFNTVVNYTAYLGALASRYAVVRKREFDADVE